MTEAAPETSGEQTAIPLLEPRDGVPAPICTEWELAEAARRLAGGTGPVAVDAERASGYRYGHRAYLVQVRRAGAGTALIDPLPFEDGLGVLNRAIGDAEWVLHAATQDLPCLADLGMAPQRVFDTELAGRLLGGYPRVGLATLVEEVLGYVLEKGHSAADWSTRPLPEPWLRYAALDVEVLIELRDALEAQLVAEGKLEWARQEFDAVVSAPPRAPRVDPWRRTSGLHKVRRPRQLAVVRELWQTRDRLAAERDLSPGRVLPDASIIAAALASPRSVRDLGRLPGFGARHAKSMGEAWYAAVERALRLPDDALPPTTLAAEGPPPARGWAERAPRAAERLVQCRAAVAALADEHRLPSENLLAPDSVRRLAWSPPDDLGELAIAQVLREHGARAWQIELAARPLSRALARARARETVAERGAEEPVDDQPS